MTARTRRAWCNRRTVGDLIRYVACLPWHVVINEVMISPTWNRGYIEGVKL